MSSTYFWLFTALVQGVLLVPVSVWTEEERTVPNFDMMLRPTIEVYAEEVANCDVADLDFSQGLASVKNICQALMDSPVCEEIHKDYRMNCNDIQLDLADVVAKEEYELDHRTSSWYGEGTSIVLGCLRGGGQAFINLGSAIFSLLQGVFILTISPFSETQAEKGLFDNFRGLKNYVGAEIEKEELKTPKAGIAVFPMVKAFWNIIWDGLKTRYWKNFACLSAEGRNKLICETVIELAGGIVIGSFGSGVVTKAFGTAWNTIKAPRAAVKTIANKNPLGKAAKQRRRVESEKKWGETMRRAESKKAKGEDPWQKNYKPPDQR